jgi:hypothetical protein
VTLVDPEGNAIMLGTEWSRFELSRAAKRVVLLADAIVHTDCMRQYPNLVRIPGIIVEGGVCGATPVGGLPWGIECNRLAVNAVSFTSALYALGCLVASGRCDVGIIGAAQVDRFGNVNTTGIWDGPIGAGGANDIACGAKRYLIMVSHESKRFVGRVSYITSPGYLDGGDAREQVGFVGVHRSDGKVEA